jgi:leucyl-tRNA synthetase
MIAPLAPHLGEECWSLLGYEKSIFENPVLFEVDEKALNVDTVTVVVQINGKVRSKIDLAANMPETEVKKNVYADQRVKLYIDGKVIEKEIYVPNKIFTIVVK